MTRSLPDAQERAEDAATDVFSTPEKSIPRFAPWPVLGIAAVVAAVHLVVGSRPRRYFDEALQLAIGRYHLDWGSVDQPPVTPLLAKLADLVAPDSPLALAVPAVLATAGAVVVAALIARDLGGDAWAQGLTALAQATGLWVAKVGHWLTPYTLEPVLWLTIVWVLVRWVRLRDDRLLLVLGIIVGVAAQTKFQTMLLSVVLLVCLAALGPRDLLRRPLAWAGFGIALLIAAPTLLWQAFHGWPQLRLASIIAEAMAQKPGRLGVAEGLVTNAGLLGMALGAVGLVALLAGRGFRDHRFLALAVLVLFAAYAIPPGRDSYLAGAYGALAAAGAVALQRAARGRFRWEKLVAWPLVALSAVAALSAVRQSTVEASPVVAVAAATTAAQAYHALPPGQRERTTLVADTFMFAAYLDTAPRAAGLPPASSGSISYGYFAPPPEGQDSVLLVGLGTSSTSGTVAALAPFFDEVRPVARTTPEPTDDVYGSDTPTTVWLLTGRQAPWTTIWPGLVTVGGGG